MMIVTTMINDDCDNNNDVFFLRFNENIVNGINRMAERRRARSDAVPFAEKSRSGSGAGLINGATIPRKLFLRTLVL